MLNVCWMKMVIEQIDLEVEKINLASEIVNLSDRFHVTHIDQSQFVLNY